MTPSDNNTRTRLMPFAIDQGDAAAASFMATADKLVRHCLADVEDPELKARARHGVLRLGLSMTTPAVWEAWLMAGEVALLARRKPRERASDLETALFSAGRSLVQVISGHMNLTERIWLVRRMEPVDVPDALVPHVALLADIVGNTGAWTLTCSARFATRGSAKLAMFEGTLQPKSSAKAKEREAA
jgi:hypothetical protein